MSDETTGELQGLLDQLRAGDKAARRAFLEQVCGRLRRLAARILYGLGLPRKPGPGEEAFGAEHVFAVHREQVCSRLRG